MNQPILLKAQPYVDAQKLIIKKNVEYWKSKGITPHLHAILVGESTASLKYLANKQKLCLDIGADFSLKQFDKNISQDKFLKHLEEINSNKHIHGCIIQLPVSGEIKNLELSRLVHPLKDVDGFHPDNVYKLYQGQIDNLLLPCTPKGILSLLKYYQIEFTGKNILIIGRSLIVGKPLALLLNHYNATVTMAHSKTKNFPELFLNSDIIISAVGKAEFFDERYFSKNKNPIIIDVGINQDDNKRTVGDFNFLKVKSFTSAITPVPGGIGPMTVISLMENLLLAVKKQNERNL